MNFVETIRIGKPIATLFVVTKGLHQNGAGELMPATIRPKTDKVLRS
jgi:hypothetical protein